MAIDADRGIFVQDDFHYPAKAEDLPTKAAFASARRIEFDTQLSLAGAAQRQTEMLAYWQVPARGFSLEVDDSGLNLSAFDGSPPVYSPEFPAFGASGGSYLPVELTLRHVRGRAALTIRGR